MHFHVFSSLCSGLPEILEIVFAANSVKHTLTDKATSRTKRQRYERGPQTDLFACLGCRHVFL